MVTRLLAKSMSASLYSSPATIADVARRARVSEMTVSRVVNGRQVVSKQTRARVLKAVEQLGYVPSASARGLAMGHTNVIGILVPDIISEWTLPLVLGAARAGKEFGYRLLLYTTGYGTAQQMHEGVPIAEGDMIDGLIIASWRVPASLARRLEARKKPVVIVDGYTRPRNVMWVCSQDRLGICMATKHLLSLGHQHIAFIGGGRRPYLAQQRRAGFLDALKEVYRGVTESWMRNGDFTRESGYREARVLFHQQPIPTAILCANDPMALGVLQAAHELGIAVPQDVSVVGCDDTLAAQASPPLTTVNRPYQAMGATALQMLADPLAFKSHKPAQVDLPTALIVRASTAAPRQKII